MINKDMVEFIRPKVVVSKCIEYDYCRWNANIIRSPVVEVLKNYVDFYPVCAEVEIGLGIPRDPVRIVLENDELLMIQSKTKRNCTNEMRVFATDYLDSLEHVDGFILKSDSPSCGLYHTKHYQSIEKGAPTLERGAGLFGRTVLNRFPDKAIETEGRLTNFRIREHWLIKLFTLAQFHEVKNSNSMSTLIQFHTRNKFLFMAYNQNIMRNLGKIAANPEKLDFNSLVQHYSKFLNDLLIKPPEYTSHINAIMHALGYFKKDVSHIEKSFFLDELEKYRAGWIPLFILLNLLQSWIVRFNKEYLSDQTYFKPYPEEIMNFDLQDSWRGRSYWNKR